jgi:hypothetical protein
MTRPLGIVAMISLSSPDDTAMWMVPLVVGSVMASAFGAFAGSYPTVADAAHHIDRTSA